MKHRYPEAQVPRTGRTDLDSSQVGWRLTSGLDYLEDEDQIRVKISGKHLPVVDIGKLTERFDLIKSFENVFFVLLQLSAFLFGASCFDP